MTQAEFQSLVRQNAEWFHSVHRETADSIHEAERQLGCMLPPSLKWLLTEWGYSSACGVDALDESIEITLRVRQSLGLPERYVILNDWQDAGVIFFDAATKDTEGEYKVYWVGTHNIDRLAEGQKMDDDVDIFDNFPAWVLSRLEEAQTEKL